MPELNTFYSSFKTPLNVHKNKLNWFAEKSKRNYAERVRYKKIYNQ